jgi:hypothetical protein
VEAAAVAVAPVPVPAQVAPAPVRVEEDSGVKRLQTFDVTVWKFSDTTMSNIFKRAPNYPPHWFQANAFYMLTASTYQNHPLMRPPKRKIAWRDSFIESSKIYNWRIIAWVALHNHYHAIVESPDKPSSLSKFTEGVFDFTGFEEVNDVPEF